MKRDQKIAISVVGAIALFIFYKFAVINHIFTWNPPAPKSLIDIKSESPLDFKVVSDNGHDIHILWTDSTNRPTYQKSTDIGMSWINVRNFEDFNPRYDSLVTMIADDRSLLQIGFRYNHFFLYRSENRGESWGKKEEFDILPPDRPIYSDTGEYQEHGKDLMAREHNGIIHQVLFSDGKIYLICSPVGVEGTYIVQSDNYGYHWGKFKKLFPNSYCRSTAPLLGAAVSNGIIHIAYIVQDRNNPIGSGIFYIRSTDNGASWEDMGKLYTPQAALDNFYNSQSFGGNPQFVVYGKNLTLFYNDQDIFYISSSDNGNSWSNAVSLRKFRASQCYPIVFKDQLLLPYITSKNEEQDWFAYLPMGLGAIFIWDGDPAWGNNDIYYGVITDDKLRHDRRLTRQLSLAVSPISGVAIDGKMTLFWCGKQNVGRNFFTRKPAAYPFEIFFKTL